MSILLSLVWWADLDDFGAAFLEVLQLQVSSWDEFIFGKLAAASGSESKQNLWIWKMTKLRQSENMDLWIWSFGIDELKLW